MLSLNDDNKVKNLLFIRYADAIVQQFRFYQTEELHLDPDLDSYSYWVEISKIQNLQGESRYEELSNLVLACLSLSHGNADAERGFSVNKAVLHHRELLKEDTIVAIRMVKDAIIQYGSVENFPMPRRLLDLCAASRKKYFVHLDIEKENAQNLQKEQEKIKANRELQEKKKLIAGQVSQLESKLEDQSIKLNAAQQLISVGNETLSNLATGKGKVDKELLLQAQMMINAGVERSKSITSSINELRKEIVQISKST